jgi:hypothetical protein
MKCHLRNAGNFVLVGINVIYFGKTSTYCQIIFFSTKYSQDIFIPTSTIGLFFIYFCVFLSIYLPI